jgi:hypothetical protein
MPSWQKLTATALVAIGVGFAGSYLSQRPGALAVLRGGASRPPVTTTPKDETLTAAQVKFEWDRASGSTRIVVVDLSRPDKPVIDRVVEGQSYEPSPDERKLFIASRQYHWFVEVPGRDGRTQSSAAAQFTVR